MPSCYIVLPLLHFTRPPRSFDLCCHADHGRRLISALQTAWRPGLMLKVGNFCHESGNITSPRLLQRSHLSLASVLQIFSGAQAPRHGSVTGAPLTAVSHRLCRLPLAVPQTRPQFNRNAQGRTADTEGCLLTACCTDDVVSRRATAFCECRSDTVRLATGT